MYIYTLDLYIFFVFLFNDYINQIRIFGEYGSYLCDKLNTYFKPLEIEVLA